jgi:NADH:ubiquinone oxidoreductase subunit 6 (subunit J)
MVETVVFVISAIVILTGALGVLLRKHPVHAALSMVQTLFGVAVLFVAMEANFLAAVQVIVYAGAIVVLFLFVIMLVGLDKVEKMDTSPLAAQKPLALLAGVAIFALMSVTFLNKDKNDPQVTGRRSVTAALVTANDLGTDEQRAADAQLARDVKAAQKQLDQLATATASPADIEAATAQLASARGAVTDAANADRVARAELVDAVAVAQERVDQLRSSGASAADIVAPQAQLEVARNAVTNFDKAKQAAEQNASDGNTKLLAKNLFNEYNFAFQATGVLLVIAVIGAVILARRPSAADHVNALDTTGLETLR